MCAKSAAKRISSFSQIKQSILENRFFEIDFTPDELTSYRSFSTSLFNAISKIETNSKYFDEIDKIQQKLADLYKKVMLEVTLPDNSALIRCFISGTYYYSRNEDIEVDDIKRFLELLRRSSKEKAIVIFSNLHSKLDAVTRYTNSTILGLDDEIPF